MPSPDSDGEQVARRHSCARRPAKAREATSAASGATHSVSSRAFHTAWRAARRPPRQRVARAERRTDEDPRHHARRHAEEQRVDHVQHALAGVVERARRDDQHAPRVERGERERRQRGQHQRATQRPSEWFRRSITRGS